MKLDLTALEIFRQAALQGSIVGAAARLNRVQSNVSTRIKQLEERLGKALFTRDRRGLTLTDDGRILLRYAERLLALSEEAEDAVAQAAPSGSFLIGAMESTAAVRLPEILARYHALNPLVEINLLTDTAGGLIKRLKSREIDVAYIAEPVEEADLLTSPVFVEELVLVTPPSIPRSGGNSALEGHTMIAFEEGCAYRRYLQSWLTEEGIRPDRILSVGSYVAILGCVSAGTGFAVVPRSVLDRVATAGTFQSQTLPEKYQRIRTLLVWRRDYISPKLHALRDLSPSGTAATA